MRFVSTCTLDDRSMVVCCYTSDFESDASSSTPAIFISSPPTNSQRQFHPRFLHGEAVRRVTTSTQTVGTRRSRALRPRERRIPRRSSIVRESRRVIDEVGAGGYRIRLVHGGGGGRRGEEWEQEEGWERQCVQFRGGGIVVVIATGLRPRN